LPAGITISPTGVISGTTTAAPGNYSFTVQALDANSAPGTQPYSITVRCSDFVITPSALASATVGSAYSAPLNAVGGSAPYLWSVASGSLPPGLSLSSSGLISGTPTQAMTASFTVEARDAFDCAATRLYTLVVNCPSLGITPATLSSAYYGSAYSQQLAASGGIGPYTWSVIAGTPPGGITLSSSGLLSGTSTVYGTASFTVRAEDHKKYDISVTAEDAADDPEILAHISGARLRKNDAGKLVPADERQDKLMQDKLDWMRKVSASSIAKGHKGARFVRNNVRFVYATRAELEDEVGGVEHFEKRKTGKRKAKIGVAEWRSGGVAEWRSAMPELN
jgi:hypothetical protein